MPYNPGLGQGHGKPAGILAGKKRHLHAHSPVNFKELRCYKNSFLGAHFWDILELNKRSGGKIEVSIKICKLQ